MKKSCVEICKCKLGKILWVMLHNVLITKQIYEIFYLVRVLFNLRYILVDFRIKDWVCLFAVNYIEGGKLISTPYAFKYIKDSCLLVCCHRLGLLMLICSPFAVNYKKACLVLVCLNVNLKVKYKSLV